MPPNLTAAHHGQIGMERERPKPGIIEDHHLAVGIAHEIRQRQLHLRGARALGLRPNRPLALLREIDRCLGQVGGGARCLRGVIDHPEVTLLSHYYKA